MPLKIAILALILFAWSEDCTAQHAEPTGAIRRKTPPFQWINDRPARTPDYVQHGTFQSAANQAEIGYCYLLPPDYHAADQQTRRYPVIYWLHGGRPGSEYKTTSMAKSFRDAMMTGQIPPMIYVFPNGGKLSHYDHGDSQGEQAFLELVKHIDQTYRTIADRAGRGIEGFSQGGRGVGRYMFKHPELFCSAAPLGGGQQHELRISENDGRESETLTIIPRWNNTWDLAKRYSEQGQAPKMRIFVAVGDEDMNFDGNRQWSAHLKRLGIDHTFVIVPGIPHSSQKMYDKIGEQIMQFHVESFRKSGAFGE